MRNRSYAVLICTIIVLSFFAQCNYPIPVEVRVQYNPDDVRTIIPLKIGDRWTYRQILHDDILSTPPDTSTISREIMSYFDSSNVRYFFLLESSLNSLLTHTSFASVTPNRYSIYTGYYLGHPIFEYPILEAPVMRGTKWPRSPEEFGTVLMRIITTDTTLVTQGGTFKHVIHVQSAGSIPSDEYFIAPTVGVIFERHSFGEAYYTRELISRLYGN